MKTMQATVDREMVNALGATEYARRQREDAESQARWAKEIAPVLAAQGFRLPTSVDEPGARYEWLRIDDRTTDDGLCKMWVVPLGPAEAEPTESWDPCRA